MAEKGKRLIFLDGCTLPAQENTALEADILPGMVIEHAATGLQKNANAATVFGSMPLIADYDILGAGDVDTALTQNEVAIGRQLESGKRANVRVLAGNNILAVGTALSRSATPGYLKIALTDGTEEIVCYADEIINVTANGLVRARGV